MQLSTNFTSAEMTHTDTNIVNVANLAQFNNLKLLVTNVLQPARDALKMPIHVNSGFRNKKVNAKVNGATNSQHMRGQAADIKCSDNAKLFSIIFESQNFDQLIWEMGDSKQPDWVHVSYNSAHNRKEIFYNNDRL